MQRILHLRQPNAKGFDRACRNADQGCRNAKYFALSRLNQAAGMFLPLTHTLASTAPANSGSFVAISKDFDETVEMQNLLHLWPTRPKYIFDCNCERSRSAIE
jgi:hypothetical protein